MAASTTVSRTADVVSSQATSFHDLCVPRRIVHALSASGYSRPSPIQEKAIPLTRLGVNVMIQAKAGTGKTLLFAVAAAERIDAKDARPQALLIAPTREVALQAANTVKDIASSCGMSVVACIGGLPTSEDERVLRKGCHVVVGTPGRILSLIERGSLLLDSLKMIVLDEADRLMEDVFFHGMREVFSHVHGVPQILALSATFQDKLLVRRLESLQGPGHTFFHVYMEDDVRSDGGVSTSLLGVAHYYLDTSGNPEISETMQQLDYIFERIGFRQCIIFCPTKKDCVDVTERLLERSYAAGFLTSERGQLERIQVLNDLRQYKTRILVCTDVAARGIDLPNVDLVCNLGGMPHDASTLAHRIGRAGRFGTRGVAVTVVAGKKELDSLQELVETARGSPVINFDHRDNENRHDGMDTRRSEATVRLGQFISKDTCTKAPGTIAREDKELPFQNVLDIVMNASLWKIDDSILQDYGCQSSGLPSHIDLVMQSVQCDVDDQESPSDRDALEILSDAFSKVMRQHCDEDIHGQARHTRSLASAQAEAVMEQRPSDALYAGVITRGHRTLAQEADELEKLWDQAMLEDGQAA